MESKLIDNIVKIRLVNEGYLPDYPYHLLSKQEMCDAFLSQDSDEGYFFDYYPCLSDELLPQYTALVRSIRENLARYYLPDTDDNHLAELPNWIRGYMLGAVISVNSNPLDIHELLVGLGCDNIEDVLTSVAQYRCYKVSKAWIDRFPSSVATGRPPSIFGEPHVMKSIRLAATAGYPARYEQDVENIVEGR